MSSFDRNLATCGKLHGYRMGDIFGNEQGEYISPWRRKAKFVWILAVLCFVGDCYRNISRRSNSADEVKTAYEQNKFDTVWPHYRPCECGINDGFTWFLEL